MSQANTVTDLWQISATSPWKFFNEITRILQEPCIRLYFWLAGIPWGRNWKIYGFPILQITRGSQIKIGDNLELRSSAWSNPLAPFHPVVLSTRSPKAKLIIGTDFKMTGGTIVAEKEVTIGNNVTVGANSDIIDTDFHPIDAHKRKENFLAGKHLPVHIGSDVFIGTRSIILKGTTIGQGAVIGAGSIISGKVPAHTIAVSNLVKTLALKK
jgi:acetyltransferase-like isoleucine patch superfamily enzyme